MVVLNLAGKTTRAHYIMAKAKPSNAALWSRAKTAAKKKFDVYPIRVCKRLGF